MYTRFVFAIDLAAVVAPGQLHGFVQDDARVNLGLALVIVAAGKGEPEPAGLASFLASEGFEKAFAWHGGPGPAIETEARMIAAAHHAHELVIEAFAREPRWSAAHQLHELLRADRDLVGGPVVRQVIADWRRQQASNVRSPGDGVVTAATLTALAFAPGHAVLAKIGDCRAFRIRAGVLESITSGEAADRRSIGVPAQDIDVQTRTVPAEPGDVFILCTHGVWAAISAGAMTRAAGAERAKDICQALHDAALASGGLDNIAMAVARLASETIRASKPDIETRVHRQFSPTLDAGARR